MSVELLLKEVGGFGLFNYFLIALTFLTTFMNGINYYSQGEFIFYYFLLNLERYFLEKELTGFKNMPIDSKKYPQEDFLVTLTFRLYEVKEYLKST